MVPYQLRMVGRKDTGHSPSRGYVQSALSTRVSVCVPGYQQSCAVCRDETMQITWALSTVNICSGAWWWPHLGKVHRSTLLVVVSSQHLTLTNTCLVIMMENRKFFFFNAIVLNRRANIFNESKYFSVISLLLRLRAVQQAAGGTQQKAGGGRRRQEAASLKSLRLRKLLD